MRWTRGRRRGRWPQGELNLMSGAHRAERTALRVRQNRVVPTPVAGAKLSVANLIQPDRLSHQAGSDGGKTNSSPGRARHKPSDHCAGNAGVLRLYLYARVRISLRTLHTRPRVRRAPGIPCSLCFEGQGSNKISGAVRGENANACLKLRSLDERSDIQDHSHTIPDIASLIRATGHLREKVHANLGRRENAKLYLTVIASAAKQSIVPQKRKTGLLRFARNDMEAATLRSVPSPRGACEAAVSTGPNALTA